MKKKYPLAVLACGIIFILFDQILKWWAHGHQTYQAYLVRPWFGWEFFANNGVAFGIPLPNTVVVALTPVILFLIGFWLLRGAPNRSKIWAVTFIIAGAISNYIDRLAFGVTIDYIRIFYSVINLADVMIVVGAVGLLVSGKQTTLS